MVAKHILPVLWARNKLARPTTETLLQYDQEITNIESTIACSRGFLPLVRLTWVHHDCSRSQCLEEEQVKKTLYTHGIRKNDMSQAWAPGI